MLKLKYDIINMRSDICNLKFEILNPDLEIQIQKCAEEFAWLDLPQRSFKPWLTIKELRKENN